MVNSSTNQDGNGTTSEGGLRFSFGVSAFLIFATIGTIAMIMILVYLAFQTGNQNAKILTEVKTSTDQNTKILTGVQTAIHQNSEILVEVQNQTNRIESATNNTELVLETMDATQKNIAQLTNDIYLMQKAETQARKAAQQVLDVLLANNNITIDEDLRRQLLVSPEASAPS